MGWFLYAIFLSTVSGAIGLVMGYQSLIEKLSYSPDEIGIDYLIYGALATYPIGLVSFYLFPLTLSKFDFLIESPVGLWWNRTQFCAGGTWALIWLLYTSFYATIVLG